VPKFDESLKSRSQQNSDSEETKREYFLDKSSRKKIHAIYQIIDD